MELIPDCEVRGFSEGSFNSSHSLTALLAPVCLYCVQHDNFTSVKICTCYQVTVGLNQMVPQTCGNVDAFTT